MPAAPPPAPVALRALAGACLALPTCPSSLLAAAIADLYLRRAVAVDAVLALPPDLELPCGEGMISRERAAVLVRVGAVGAAQLDAWAAQVAGMPGVGR